MAFDNRIGITITAIDQASTVVERTAAQIKASQEEVAASSASGAAQVETSVKRTGSQFASLAPLMATTVIPAAAIATGAAIKMAYDFQSQMELIRTSAGLPQSAIGALSDKILAMSGEVGQAPEKLAEGFYHIASAGNGIWNTAQMMDILKVSAEGANLGLADMDSTTYALSSTMASGISGIKNATEAMAVLNAIVGAGDMRMEDLNGAIGTGVLSTMKVAGVDIRSFGAALATLADNGEHADEAATRLRMSIALMSSPSGAASKQLQALGLTAEDAKNATSDMNAVFAKSGLTTTTLADDLRKPNGITEAMKDLQSHLENAGLSASETDAMLAKGFGGGRTDAAILTMLTNIDRMDDKFHAINDSAGQFNSKLADLNNTPAQRVRDSFESIHATMTSIGGVLLPAFASGLKNVANSLDGISRTSAPFVKVVEGSKSAQDALKVLVGVMRGPIPEAEMILNGALNATGPVFSTLARDATSSASALKSGFNQMAGDARSSMSNIRSSVTSALASLPGIVRSATSSAGSWLYSVGRSIVEGLIRGVRDAIGGVGSAISSIGSNVGHAVSGALHSLHVPGFAVGTNFAPGGLSLVGENGPELINLPTGSRVYTNQQTQQMMQGGGDIQIAFNGPVNMRSEADVDRLARRVVELLSTTQRLNRLGVAG